jgi:hypothetical protein
MVVRPKVDVKNPAAKIFGIVMKKKKFAAGFFTSTLGRTTILSDT